MILIILILLSTFQPKDVENQTNTLANKEIKIIQKDSTENDAATLYKQLGLENQLNFQVFEKALKGMNQLNSLKNKNILTIIDFSKPSTEKRFFVVDLQKKKVLYASLVAHGKNSGDNFATNFSNSPKSLCSSLGFYVTAETYMGKHGYSLKLDGMEKGINDKARERAVVVHGADYVNNDFAKVHGRLGRSWGCPALPTNISKEVIETIANGSCLFIYANDSSYKQNSRF